MLPGTIDGFRCLKNVAEKKKTAVAVYRLQQPFLFMGSTGEVLISGDYLPRSTSVWDRTWSTAPVKERYSSMSLSRYSSPLGVMAK